MEGGDESGGLLDRLLFAACKVVIRAQIDFWWKMGLVQCSSSWSWLLPHTSYLVLALVVQRQPLRRGRVVRLNDQIITKDQIKIWTRVPEKIRWWSDRLQRYERFFVPSPTCTVRKDEKSTRSCAMNVIICTNLGLQELCFLLMLTKWSWFFVPTCFKKCQIETTLSWGGCTHGHNYLYCRRWLPRCGSWSGITTVQGSTHPPLLSKN